jgi:hypothetical protein
MDDVRGGERDSPNLEKIQNLCDWLLALPDAWPAFAALGRGYGWDGDFEKKTRY